MNYYDILLAKKIEDDRDPQVVGLSVTENGTYAEEGKVYKPVVVNVPLGSKNITANGVYNAASDNLKGFSSVDVNVEGYKISEVSGLPSPIATFSDGNELPMPNLKIAVEPVQEGSGDPSPENIRPISGWSAVDVTRTGKNLWNNEWSAYTQPSDYRICPIKLENGQYTASVKLKEGGTRQSGFTLGIAKQGDRYSNFGSFYTASTGADKTGTITVDDAWTSPKLIIYCNNETAFNAIFENYEIQLEEGATATTYEPYNGSTITIQLGDTYYGGKLDVVSGVLTLTHGYIASYNGETLPSTWISDRDVYAEGTTPTIGAEVCYYLATPTTIQLTPTAVKSLLGTNNLSANTGDVVEASYWEEL